MDNSVLVVGGGIAGLALARALRERDVPVEIAERGGSETGGLAINLPGNAITALTALGVGEGLQKLGRPTRRREYRSARDRVLFAVDEDDFWGPEARPRCVRRKDLLALLADGLDVPRHAPGAVESVRQAPGGAEAVFADDTSQRYGFIAGADGVRSVVRTSLFGAASTRQSLLSAASWRFMAPNPGVDCWTVWSGDGGAFLLLPVDEHEVYGYASGVRGGPIGAEPSWLHETFGDFPDPVRAVLASIEKDPATLYHSPIEEVRAASWASGRCALIGDAAHATAPVWAQGAALAVEDALVLSGLLAGGEWDTVGARYEAKRRDRVTHVQTATDRFSRAAGLPTWLRNPLMPIVGPRVYRETYGSLRTLDLK
ncbi:putative FAD-dependent monooxygenase [Actinoplanes missouriensis 431]|uniref:Putative FAD-dependent monooxygenase n=1 Tax=Actinoplanes missouriensis (strain ATCC 14538 / DSM 43046 / CBS 188.64 / JCM 3121 / NBRC 102363 / NCIMB 12654 / NRRL B-3342 / UNCC 431) TaxID=512565 RepID=I0H379_ACTM4|nr:NAD(P)/FAD-dependent oxidoreductase [Actinoplanes missouriensis]BAL87466.1 putative FAD-dependent monooxygenase [Actinoplanes missouriensis 431]